MPSDYHLRRWLMLEVHGVKIPRERRKQRRGPTRNFRYRAWIRTLPCAACDRQPAEAAHTGSDGGQSQKASDYSCVPLCADCHTMGPRAYHRIGREQFEQAHNLDLKALVKRLNYIWFRAIYKGTDPVEEEL